MFEKAKWCVSHPGECAQQYVPERVYQPAAQAYQRAGEAVGRGRAFVQRERQAVGRKFEEVAPNTARRVQDWQEDRQYAKQQRREEKAEKRQEAIAQWKRINEARERKKDHEAQDRLEEKYHCERYPEDCANFKREKRTLRLQEQNKSKEALLKQRTREVQEKQNLRDAKRAEYDNQFFGGQLDRFIGFAYDEVKYATKISRPRSNPYATTRDPHRPRAFPKNPATNLKGRPRKSADQEINDNIDGRGFNF